MNSVVSLCLLEILYIIFIGASDCPDLWVPYHGSCYLFGHQNYSFPEAEKYAGRPGHHYCESYQDGHLVHLEAQDESAFIKDHITYATYKRWWIGLTDEGVEGVWVWNGLNEKPEFTDWGPGEPNGGHRESCAEMVQYSPTSLHWNDAPCTVNKPMICEKPAGNAGNPGIIG